LVTPDPRALAYSDDDGQAAVRLARAAIEAAVGGHRLKVPPLGEAFDRKAGVFTTLTVHATGQLRGCIGFAEPVMPLRDALVESARAAALEDSRFDPVEPRELALLGVEVSLLTPPHELPAPSRGELPSQVRVGRHGLIVRRSGRSGLLLPQVAQEWSWGPEEFLEQTCRKAGLDKSAWRESATRVLAFEAEVFSEESPGGPVRRHATP
jgi:uncharacterized protein (TIGR00296 family)